MKLVLAIDGGNSKTLAAIADESGRVLAVARAGGSNYQGIGRDQASSVLGDLINEVLALAGVDRVDAACYGLAGADRDQDFEAFHQILAPLDPAGASVLVNDTILALRAGTPDGVGVALIGGAGSNCIGMDRSGRVKKAWGLGPLTGDRANAYSIVLDAVVRAMKGIDGRGPKTMLEDKFKQALGVDQLEDVIEFEFADSRRPFNFGSLAPLVFEAAAAGDEAALAVLDEHGHAAAEAALAVMGALFSPGEPVTLALGGSVYQKGACPVLVDSVRNEVTAEFPHARMIVLSEHPLLGGLLRAGDELPGAPVGAEVSPTQRRELAAALKAIDQGIATDD